MQIVTSRQMQEIDRATIEGGHASGLELMERAGQGLLPVAMRFLSGKSGAKAAIVCGKGNNGGDGFVLARLLKSSAVDSTCFLLAPESELKGDAHANFLRVKDLGIPCRQLETDHAFPDLDGFSLVVDAIFGTGFSGRPRGLAAETIEGINRCGIPVLAVDAPSGANMNDGTVSDPCVKANVTVTLGLPKIGQFWFPAKELCGELVIHGLGFPDKIIDEHQIDVELVDKAWAQGKLPRRPQDGHKGTFGKVLLVAGSRGMTGAALLAAEAALRSGAGMVTVAAPRKVQPILNGTLREIMTMALPETPEGTLSRQSLDGIMEMADTWADVLVVGPGLGRGEETGEVAREIVRRVERPMVVDADGLNAFARHAEELLELPFPRILTPHFGELNRLWRMEKDIPPTHRLGAVQQIARDEFGNTLLLKGAPTLVGTPTGEVYVNASGNSGLATAGSGDVLSGIVGGLLAQGMEGAYAAPLASFLHGHAADLACGELGEYSMIAGDVLRFLPAAIRAIQGPS